MELYVNQIIDKDRGIFSVFYFAGASTNIFNF